MKKIDKEIKDSKRLTIIMIVLSALGVMVAPPVAVFAVGVMVLNHINTKQLQLKKACREWREGK